MSFSGGVYTLPGPALVTGEVVSATENNQFRNDVAGAFNVTMLRNGTSTATANLPMGGYKLTGLGVATTSGDALSYGQAAVISDFTASGTVTISSGTANGVAYLNGSKVLTTGSALTFDGSKFGIGKTPSASTPQRLQIKQPDAIYSGISIEKNDDDSYLGIGYWSGTGAWTFAPTYQSTGSYLPLAFAINGSEQMRLTSTGLGIGTSSPSAKLQVDGESRFARSGTGSTQYLSITGDSTGANITSTCPAGQAKILTLSDDSNGGGISLKAVSASPITFLTSNTERMRLDSSGNLGLGVTPSAWRSTQKVLQVGSASISQYSNLTVALGYNIYSDASNVDRYIGNGYANQYFQYNGQHIWYNAPSGTAGNAISFTQAMTLDASGNLGIGTSSPVSYGANYKTVTINGSTTGVLDIQANGTTQLEMSVASNYAQISAVGASGVLAFTTAGNTERMRIDSSGNVGIGTSSPVNNGAGRTSLTVNGTTDCTLFLQSNGSNGGYIQGISTGLSIVAQPNLTLANYATGTGVITYNTGGSERMRIDSSGNLLVGTTSNAYMSRGLKVSGNTSTGADYTLLCDYANSTESFGLRNDGYFRSTATYNRTTASAANVVVDGNQFLVRSTSALKYKKDVRDIENVDINKFRPVRYKSKCESDDQTIDHFGIIADEVDAAGIKELVTYGANGEIEGFQYERLTVVLVKAIQELKAELDATKAEVAALKGN